MAIQNTTSQAAKLTLTAVFRLVPLLLSGGPLSETAAHVSRIVCALTCELLKFAPPIILAGCQALASFFFAHQHLFLCVQTLLSSWQLLHSVCGAD
jgi:hypothetical protein